MNVGSVFERAMDFSFRDLIGRIIQIYQDDLIMFYKERGDHLQHLRKVFESCRKYGISLPEEVVFGVDEGKLLGHVISKEVIKVDPSNAKVIQQVPLPRNKKQCNLSLVR
jgi:hypothetical protein